MATLRRGLVDKVKKAASKVRTRGVQAAAKAGTRGARVLVETTVAAVKTVDKLQQKLGGRPSKVRLTPKAAVKEQLTETPVQQPEPKAAAPMKPAKTETAPAKGRRAASRQVSETPAVEMRDSGRKTMPAAAPKRSTKAKEPAPAKQFKVKRGQKHLHSGR
ncbi:hypothetical protein [Hyalangium minutum]|uniref:Uncharacterized protein n=1 Tax=Hyalangium minutum TaxID=394096 RepID=A0A085WLS7_9BACT|nr:hypothetical protein [Hyalangium minutum]KFE68640.1 hypothetical protein DB31_7877 [Hyalangium minutum]